MKTVDQLNKTVQVFRDSQHRNFIQTMKKLKSLDLPDLVKTVKSKKLPKEALRTVLNRFTIVDDKLELVESAETLKQNAAKESADFNTKNESFIAEMKKQIEFFD